MAEYQVDYRLLSYWIGAITILSASVFLVLTQNPLESSEAPESLEISLSPENIEAGETTTVTVQAEDEGVQATIYFQGSQIQTSGGTAELQVEEPGTYTVRAEYRGLEDTQELVVEDQTQDEQDSETDTGDQEDGSEDTQDSEDQDQESEDGQDSEDQGSDDETQVDQPENELELIAPEDGASYTSEPQEISFEFTSPESTQYLLRVNGERIAQGTSQGTNTVTETFSPGSYEWSVRKVENQQMTDSEIRSFDISRPSEISIIEDLTSVESNEVTVTFEVANAPEYRVNVDGDLVEESEASDRDTYTHTFENSGTHTIQIQALEKGEVSSSASREFTTEGKGSAQISWDSPESFNAYAPTVDLGVISDRNYNLELLINEGTDEYQYRDRVNASSSTESLSFNLDPLPQGTHDYQVRAENMNQQQIGSLSGTFETTEPRPVAVVDRFEYDYTDDHVMNVELTAYEDLEYSVEVAEFTPVQNESFTGGGSLVDSVGVSRLESGREYTATLKVNSTETGKNLQEQTTFTTE